ncbi:polysaccharide deacetylase family protein [Streptomyces sp. NPDC006422]|uniref:polysaccharide deacetylase family protein n=1 Tax=unclassified Streptomyces TaxID=2593676 RepID=UPI0033AA0ADA
MTARGARARFAVGVMAIAAVLAGCAQRPAPDARTAAGAPPHRTVPPVVSRVPTHDRVVFLAYEDGAGARLVDLVRERRLPLSLFAAGRGEGRLRELRALGVQVQNRTLTRPFLPGLGYVEQHAEICGQRDRIEGRFGTAPRLFHPPSGAYDGNTLRAAAACGVDAVVLWREPDGAPLHPGDIIGAHPATTRQLLHRIESEGYTVAPLENYL